MTEDLCPRCNSHRVDVERHERLDRGVITHLHCRVCSTRWQRYESDAERIEDAYLRLTRTILRDPTPRQDYSK